MSVRVHDQVKAKRVKAKLPATARKPTPPARAASDDQPVVQRAKAQIAARAAAREAEIARGAYFRAERRGFAPGHELDDWLAAESQVDNGPIEILGSVEDPVEERHGAPDVTPVR